MPETFLYGTPYRTDGSSSSVEAMKPTIGRIVHYTNLADGKNPPEKQAIITRVNSDGSVVAHYTNLADGKDPPETQAALITRVNSDGSVALKVFYTSGIFDIPAVPFSDEPARGHWNWPPRV